MCHRYSNSSIYFKIYSLGEKALWSKLMLHQLIEINNLRIHNIGIIIIGEFLNFCLWNGLCLFRSEVNINSFLLVYIRNQFLKYINEEEAICSFLISLLQVPKIPVQKQRTPMWALVSITLEMKSWSNKHKFWQLKIFTTVKLLNSHEKPC